MKVKHLGTAACEGWPAMFCTCDNCSRARKSGGRNIRTRSQAIINDDLLIDIPADTYAHVLYQDLDLSRVKDLLVTHTHCDHYVPTELENRRRTFAYLPDENSVLTVHGMEPAREGLSTFLAKPDVFRIGFSEIEPLKEYEVGNYKVVALPADHDKSSGCVIYSISDGDKNILYANDTGYFPEETWQYMIDNKMVFDYVSLDCTCIVQDAYRGHMGLKATFDVKERMISEGLADSSTLFALNHFSHNGVLTYDELTETVGYDFIVAYDGLEVIV